MGYAPPTIWIAPQPEKVGATEDQGLGTLKWCLWSKVGTQWAQDGGSRRNPPPFSPPACPRPQSWRVRLVRGWTQGQFLGVTRATSFSFVPSQSPPLPFHPPSDF